MKVSVVMGSKSDREVVQKTVNKLKEFGVEVDFRIISAHRTPQLAHDYAKGLEDIGSEVLICAAGKLRT